MDKDLELYIENLSVTKKLSWSERLEFVSKEFPGRAIFSTSFSIEDQIITHIIGTNKLDIDIFTLDTGRMFDETYEVWQQTKEKYNINIKPYYPDSDRLKEYVETNGINAFYESKDLRLSCCGIRKVEPLKRALQGYDVWISGLRTSQSKGRDDKDLYEIDSTFEVVKLYPILELSDDQIWAFIKKEDIPYNKLYDKGFTSIGCAPCSQVPTDPDDPRSGRWWWEDENQKECGLHMVDGKLVRKK
ncbi:MAG: phosphoadenylyl-sulfate reductase [Rickettsiales bacterium]|jgi:phosphoadenosine phosphosulfate reductase|nr:phosphoadenylyl-sulfate reductase [Rickettsiales bacterium]